ncbi:hypothetical protein ACT2FY_08645 [Paraburkholderia fungorum]|uniref:hypothetical protein n=1 Tax=Paraburkholderia fungorum TaxID=134537 RepID=UPI00402B2940
MKGLLGKGKAAFAHREDREPANGPIAFRVTNTLGTGADSKINALVATICEGESSEQRRGHLAIDGNCSKRESRLRTFLFAFAKKLASE